MSERDQGPVRSTVQPEDSAAVAGSADRTVSERPRPILEIVDLQVGYRLARRRVHWAVDGVSLNIARGEAVGLIGESGSGKSTLGRAIIGMSDLVSGHLSFDKQGPAQTSRPASDSVAMVFQDSTSSLDPRLATWRSVTEPLKVRDHLRSAVLRQRAEEALREVGLPVDLATRRPSQLSGGQRQRVNIARALVLSPELVICDEPTSALDVSAQAGILNLLRRLRRRRGISYLFISHDLAVVRAIASRVAVMYLGKIVEVGPAEQCIRHPAHPYTKALIASIPEKGKNFLHEVQSNLRGEVADPRNVPTGCRFRTRCPHAQEICEADVPLLRELEPDHLVACHLAEQIRQEEDRTSIPGASA